MKTIQWTDFAENDPFHVIRVQLPSQISISEHTHSDYAELFLIECGGITHRINNNRDHLDAGTLVLIRPADIHHLKMEKEGTVYSNIAIPLSTIQTLQKRYLAPETFLWDLRRKNPAQFILKTEALARMIQGIDQLSRAPRTRLEIDRFLLNLFHELRQSDGLSADSKMPNWLARACCDIKEPALALEGLPAFNRLAGRSPEHVSRVLKNCTGKTPTQWVNEARLHEAAHQLCMTSHEIIDIAADCGFENLSYFYRLFKQHYALSPRHYRLANYAVVASG